MATNSPLEMVFARSQESTGFVVDADRKAVRASVTLEPGRLCEAFPHCSSLLQVAQALNVRVAQSTACSAIGKFEVSPSGTSIRLVRDVDPSAMTFSELILALRALCRAATQWGATCDLPGSGTMARLAHCDADSVDF